MEWNSKWDWENLVGIGSKSNESGKKVEWMIVDENVCGGGNSGVTYGCSAKSCISESERLIGLRLGKRTYFENSSSSKSVSCVKKSKSSSTPRCQVEGCNADLSVGKEYHRKHRVCDSHSKCSKVVVGGLERRFCQQCSRFHSLCEFDESKRSCRKRLSQHNARRRKPQQETIHFNSTPFPFNGNNSSSSSSNFTLPMMASSGRALSLLSNNNTCDFWLTGQTSTNTNFQDIQLSPTPYDASADFYSNMFN